MKIIDKIKSGKVTISFEVFPPKTNDAYEDVLKAAGEIAARAAAGLQQVPGMGQSVRPAVQPDDRGPQGLSLPVHAEQRFALRRQRDRADLCAGLCGQRQNALCCRVQIHLRLHLGAHTARLQSIFPARQRRLPELTVKQAGFYGRRADVQRQNQLHVLSP